MNEKDKLIQDQLDTLPKPLREALNVIPWRTITKEIALSNNLNFEQVSNMERETMLILYGFENPLDYINNLIKEVGISEDLAISIAEETNKKLFSVISNKADELEKREVITQIPTPPTPIKHDNLPMVEPGEVAHNVPHIKSDPIVKREESTVVTPTQKLEANQPKPEIKPFTSHYPGGKDPYREPIE